MPSNIREIESSSALMAEVVIRGWGEGWEGGMGGWGDGLTHFRSVECRESYGNFPEIAVEPKKVDWYLTPSSSLKAMI